MRATVIMGLLGIVTANAGEPTALEPFKAHYRAEWKNLNVGTSDLDLRRNGTHYIYTWKISARGIFRLLYGNDVIQTSWFFADSEHVSPEKYHAEDGASKADLAFDWSQQIARGHSDSKPIEIKLRNGTQDVMSIQAEVMLGLRNGNLPKTFPIIDKDELKEFTYTQEGHAEIQTELGRLDTLVVASQREGGDRVLRMWFAPSLGFVPVQAERTRNGSLEFAMRIRSLNSPNR